MASKTDIFSLSGPLHLSDVDWKSAHHRRSVAACLVQGVYVLERDRQTNRQGPNALASPWWEFFHFQPIRLLVDDVDSSIFGIVYEFRPPPFGHKAFIQSTPKYVIAFRGTITKGDSVTQDLKLDLDILVGIGLHCTSRFKLAIQAVQNVVAGCGDLNIWIAGHSLGSAIGMLAGKEMASTGIFLEAFFFNPPFPSIETTEKVKHGILIASSYLTTGLSMVMKWHNQKSRSDTLFTKLSLWVPSLYVHPRDHICSEYIGYFERRKRMGEMGAGGIQRLKTQNSVDNHLLPSASLITNLNPASGFIQAHGLHQWWRPDMQTCLGLLSTILMMLYYLAFSILLFSVIVTDQGTGRFISLPLQGIKAPWLPLSIIIHLPD